LIFLKKVIWWVPDNPVKTMILSHFINEFQNLHETLLTASYQSKDLKVVDIDSRKNFDWRIRFFDLLSILMIYKFVILKGNHVVSDNQFIPAWTYVFYFFSIFYRQSFSFMVPWSDEYKFRNLRVTLFVCVFNLVKNDFRSLKLILWVFL